ncbi:MAG: hypothetical protein U5J63_11200 [Fodinibius sp.]|nr:hypothetical protein [Fodinibius sp.]
MEELKNRLSNRGSETDKSLYKAPRAGRKRTEFADHFDYVRG